MPALLQEAAATAEALEAEKAAKFAADAEARELQRMLNEVRAVRAVVCAGHASATHARGESPAGGRTHQACV